MLPSWVLYEYEYEYVCVGREAMCGSRMHQQCEESRCVLETRYERDVSRV